MKYKMIVTDLDRTLLRADKSVSDYTLRTLNKLRLDKIKIVFATARPIREIKGLIKKFYFDSCIYHNGAVVEFEKDIIFHKGIYDSVSIVQRMLRINPSLKISIEANDTLYSNFNAKEIWPHAEFFRTENFIECRDKVTEKIVIQKKLFEQLDINDYIRDDLYYQISENNVAMILNKEANKVNGVKMLATKYGIDIKDIVAFGDDYNDIGMLKKCGLGVAVDNAYREVKYIADDICDCNDKDGVAKYINEILYG